MQVLEKVMLMKWILTNTYHKVMAHIFRSSLTINYVSLRVQTALFFINIFI